VYDGDTVRLTEGRGLRLIGLDTPVLGHNGAPDQAYTQRAIAALRTYSHSMITRCCCAMTWKAAITMRAGSRMFISAGSEQCHGRPAVNRLGDAIDGAAEYL